MDREEIEQRVARFATWFHNIDLKGVATNPSNADFPASRWRQIEPYVPASLAGKTVLDLGCNAGYFAVKMRERGAKVLGIDWYPEAVAQARLVAEVLELDIDYREQNLYEFVLRNDQVFDYVLFLGTFYHLRYPLLVLDRLAEITRSALYFQTIVAGAEDALEVPASIDDYGIFGRPGFPSMYFVEGNLSGAFNNWFVCNPAAVFAALRSAGFEDVRRSGHDCFVATPRSDLASGWRAAHDLAALKLAEPALNTRR